MSIFDGKCYKKNDINLYNFIQFINIIIITNSYCRKISKIIYIYILS